MAEKTAKPTPTDELLARFQLDNERAIATLRRELLGLHEELARRVASLSDDCRANTVAVERQTRTLEDAVHHTRRGVDECNLALKEAAKAAREAADSAAVFEKLKDSQPNFADQVRALERRLATVVDKNTHLEGLFRDLNRKMDELEVLDERVEEARGDLRGLDIAVKRLDSATRTRAPLKE
jgi:predicted  nucleic acid-binding Zn-ribbon protein